MSDTVTSGLWTQFRRLFTGTVVELLQERGFETRKLRVDFSADSRFQVPRLDNYMRFVGVASSELERVPTASELAQLRRDLETAWPGLVACLDIPLGDRLTVDRVRVEAVLEGQTLKIRFDLVAD